MLHYLRQQQEKGRIRATAEAVLLVDTSFRLDLKSWASFKHRAAWQESVSFDERASCRQRSSKKMMHLCSRAKGRFIVAGIPLNNSQPTPQATFSSSRRLRWA